VIAGAILLLIAACALVAAELFLPSHGVMGVLAALCAIAGVIVAFHVAPLFGFFCGIVLIILAPLVFYWAVKLYPKSPVGKRVMLDTPQVAGEPSQEAARLTALVGRRGIAMTTLRPAGSVELDNQRIDAMSESTVIDAGAPVEVIRVVGRKVIVRPVM
jgi:membrane-bound serine protease (ClpP class)